MPATSTTHAGGHIELGLVGGTEIAAEARAPNAREGRDDAAGADFADPLIVLVRDVEFAGRPEGDRPRVVERCGECRSGVAGKARGAVTCDRADDAAGGGDEAHDVVGGVSDIEIASSIEGEAVRPVEGCVRGKQTIPGVAVQRWLDPATVEMDAGERVDPPDDVIAGVGEVKVPGSVQRERRGAAERGRERRLRLRCSRSARCRRRLRWYAGRGVDAADTVVAGVGQEEISRHVGRYAEGKKDG